MSTPRVRAESGYEGYNRYTHRIDGVWCYVTERGILGSCGDWSRVWDWAKDGILRPIHGPKGTFGHTDFALVAGDPS